MKKAILILVIGAILLAGCGTPQASGSTIEPVSEVQEASIVAVATAIPLTPNPATATPKPPTLIVTQGLTTQELAYIEATVSQTEALGDSVERFASLVENPKFSNSNWKTSIASELAIWQTVYKKAKELVPPPRLQKFHEKYLQAMSLGNDAANDITRGLDNLDVNLINAANRKMNQSGILLEEASQLLEDILEDIQK